RSPFGAVTITRGWIRSVANNSTLKPAGTFGHASFGRFTWIGPLSADSVAKAVGRSATVILRRTPGASCVQSPIALFPVLTVSAANPLGNWMTVKARGRTRLENRIREVISELFESNSGTDRRQAICLLNRVRSPQSSCLL